MVCGLDYYTKQAFLAEAGHLLAVYHAPEGGAVESHVLPVLCVSWVPGWILELLDVLKLRFLLTAFP